MEEMDLRITEVYLKIAHLKWEPRSPGINDLTHWGRVTHICVGKLAVIVSDNGLSPGRRQAIIGTNGGILLIGPLGTNFSEIVIGIQTFSFKKMYLKMSSAKWRPFCLGLNELMGPSVGSVGPLGQVWWKCARQLPHCYSHWRNTAPCAIPSGEDPGE